MTSSKFNNSREIVASFCKAKKLRAAVAEIVELGINKYDINATAPFSHETCDDNDSYYGVWIWIQNLEHIDVVSEILERHGGENIHIDDYDELRPDNPHIYNLQAALNDPDKVFSTPEALMASHFAPDVKRDMLERWAYEIKQQEIADDEGMPSKAFIDILGDIAIAILSLKK